VLDSNISGHQMPHIKAVIQNWIPGVLIFWLMMVGNEKIQWYDGLWWCDIHKFHENLS